SDNLMPGYDWHLVRREIPFDNVKIGAADTADAYFHPNLACPGPRCVYFLQSQGQLLHALLLSQDHRAHWFKISRSSFTLVVAAMPSSGQDVTVHRTQQFLLGCAGF